MMHPWFKDYGKDVPRVTKRFFTGALSGLTIYLIVILAIYGKEIDNAITVLISLILVDKALGTTIGILILSVVCWLIIRYSKRGNF